jgi:hypothetical protein
MEKKSEQEETNLTLELLDRTNFNIFRNILERLPQFQTLHMIRCNDFNIFVRYRREEGHIQMFKLERRKKNVTQSMNFFTSSKFPAVLQLLDIIFHLEYFFDVEERRRRRLAFVFSRDSMEYHGEFLEGRYGEFKKLLMMAESPHDSRSPR